MADFTTTALSITPLLETTFISDMRIIVNANSTVLKSKIEDIINTLQIDLVNKYIGSNLPIGRISAQRVMISSDMQFMNGTSSSAASIASLTQASGVSTFTTNNLLFTRSLTATANTSKAALRTVVVGGTSGSALLYPTSGGVGAPGLYVGDATRSVNSEFYGDVKFGRSSVTHSADTNVGTSSRVIGGAVRFGTGYSVLKLVVSKTDPQFMVVDIQLNDNDQTNSKPIWLQLHEDYTTNTSRPNVGQSFTIMINNILNSAGTPISTSDWPSVVATTSTDPGINIMSGYIADATSGSEKYKIAYINDSEWSPSIPADGTSAAAAASSGMSPSGHIRLYNPAQQAGIAGTNPNKLGATVTLTKISQEPNFSRYVITGGNNFVYVNTPASSPATTTTTAAPTTTTTTAAPTTTTTTTP
jgi:hypothetical protein